MFRNYLTIALRNLRRQPFYTFIFISGLALGLTAFLLLQQYTSFEQSYDRFHYQPDRLYRLTTDQVAANGELSTRDAMSHAPAGKLFQETFPEVERYTTTYKTERLVFKKQQQAIEELNAIAVDEHFLDLFAYHTTLGDPSTMLTEPYSIVLTASQAEKYFGTENPIGKTMEEVDELKQPFTVTGVIADVPGNTHYHFDLLVSLASYREGVANDHWNGYNYYTYLLLGEQAKISNIEAQIPALSKKYMGERDQLVFNLQAVPDIHLQSDFTFEPQVHGSAKAVKFLGVISIFILLIAWVNYINLSTAKAMERAKEVGLRKVIGARKRQLMGQFFMESVLINLFGTVLALALTFLLAPSFNALVGKAVISGVFSNAPLLLQLGGFFLLGTLATGLYPALVLSSFMPITALRGSYGRSTRGVFLRKLLVVLQFSASLLLIASTLVIYRQVNHMRSLELGMNTQQVLTLTKPSSGELSWEAYRSKIRAFEETLLGRAGINKIGSVQNLPGGSSFDINSSSGGARIPGLTELVEGTIYITRADDTYFDVLDVGMLAGRNFDEDLAVDSVAFILNEAFVRMLNLPSNEAAVSQVITLGGDADATRYPIVGVIQDFNRSSLKNTVEPTIFVHSPNPNNWVIKLQPEQLADNIAFIKQQYQQVFPNSALSYAFLDERFELLYAEDQRFGSLFLYFSVLAIFVAFMGLFGLASYLALQRAKEVGIRKVLGASVANIILLFFRDFFYLLLIAIAIGIPLSYLSMNAWLAGYAHRISFPWSVLSLAVFAITALAFLTVSYQTWRLALLNPTETIRQE